MAYAEQTQIYDLHTPVTAHEGLAAAQFAEHFSAIDGPVLNVAAGNTNLQKDLRSHGHEIDVISLDPQYNDLIIDRVPGRIKGTAQEIPYGDESFALTMCQFGLQHMDEPAAKAAVREMVRVTQTAESIADNSRGTVLLGPIFKKGYKALVTGILESFDDVAGTEEPPSNTRSKAALPTMIIKKTAALTPEKLDGLIELMQKSGAFKPTRRSLGELASRAFGGSSTR